MSIPLRPIFLIALSILFAIGVFSACGTGMETPSGNGPPIVEDAGHDAGEDSGFNGGSPDGGVPDGGTDAGIDGGAACGGGGCDGGTDGGTGDGGTDAGVGVSYELEIQPIFDGRCVSCHNSATHSGNLDLSEPDSRSRLVAVPSSCNPSVMRVAPFDTAGSMLWRKTAGDPSRCLSPMPLGTAGLRVIAPMEFDLLERWILQGALDN